MAQREGKVGGFHTKLKAQRSFKSFAKNEDDWIQTILIESVGELDAAVGRKRTSVLGAGQGSRKKWWKGGRNRRFSRLLFYVAVNGTANNFKRERKTRGTRSQFCRPCLPGQLADGV